MGMIRKLRQYWTSSLVFRSSVVMYGIVFLPLTVLLLVTLVQLRGALEEQTAIGIERRARLVTDALEWEMLTVRQLGGTILRDEGVRRALTGLTEIEDSTGEFRSALIAGMTSRISEEVARIRSSFVPRTGTSVHFVLSSDEVISIYPEGDSFAGTPESIRPRVKPLLLSQVRDVRAGFQLLTDGTVEFVAYRLPWIGASAGLQPTDFIILVQAAGLYDLLTIDPKQKAVARLANGTELFSIGTLDTRRGAEFRNVAVQSSRGTITASFSLPIMSTIERIGQVQRRLIGLIAAGALLSGVMSFAALRSAFKPVRSIVNELLARIDVDETDPRRALVGDLRGLRVGITGLENRITSLVDDLVERERSQMRLHYQAVRAQVTPHFVYNALNSLRWKLVADGNEEAATILMRLGFLIERSTTRFPELIPLSEEVEILRAFVDIERFRYRQSIDFAADIAPELRSMLFPRFCLQPLVENALLHGGGETSSLHVLVRAIRTNSGISIVVSNRTDRRDTRSGGVKLQERIALTGIGIQTIRERIQHEFRGQSCVTLTTRPDGADAVIEIDGV